MNLLLLLWSFAFGGYDLHARGVNGNVHILPKGDDDPRGTILYNGSSFSLVLVVRSHENVGAFWVRHTYSFDVVQ